MVYSTRQEQEIDEDTIVCYKVETMGEGLPFNPDAAANDGPEQNKPVACFGVEKDFAEAKLDEMTPNIKRNDTALYTQGYYNKRNPGLGYVLQSYKGHYDKRLIPGQTLSLDSRNSLSAGEYAMLNILRSQATQRGQNTIPKYPHIEGGFVAEFDRETKIKLEKLKLLFTSQAINQNARARERFRQEMSKYGEEGLLEAFTAAADKLGVSNTEEFYQGAYMVYHATREVVEPDITREEPKEE